MKAQRRLAHLGLFLLAASCLAPRLPAQSPLPLEVRSDAQGWALSWPARLRDAHGVEQSPAFELQRSDDLGTWTSVGPVLQGTTGAAGEVLTARMPTDAPRAFYRVVARFPSDRRVAKLGQGGAEVFGYASAFEEELKSIGLITPEQFAERFPAPNDYLAGLTWDPTAADFWPEFNTDPEIYNTGLIEGVDDFRLHDFRLNADELALFKQNGFVVSERLGGPSPGEIFSRIWVDDLPVFIATDPILHAWHRSYDMMLAELEETYLFENLRQMLDGMASKAADAAQQAGSGPLKESVRDADYFLTVARSLLLAARQPSALGQDERVAITLKAVSDLQLNECFELFSEPRAVDFSQFKPRGHYTESKLLGRYFQAVMWLGRTDLRVAGGPFKDSPCAQPHPAPIRELGTAVVLHQLLRDSGQFERWRQFDNLIQRFVGWTDSMTFGQLGDVLKAAEINSLADVPDLAALKSLQEKLELGQVGVQNIRSDWFASPLGPGQIKLPHSFTVFGQKFILDSWALSKVVFDDILWDENGVPEALDKVPRRVPSGLDVAFSVFGNNQITPELVARITDQSASRHQFRDGWFYQHNLAAVRAVVERHPASAWGENLYMNWLAALRELSAPLTEAKYPDAVRTRAWAMKDVNTQLASWTQLRHDTVLYAKQSYTGWGDACSYPKGFVEPRPQFWRRMHAMAESAARLILSADYRGTFQIEMPPSSGAFIEMKLIDLQTRQAACFKNFAEVSEILLDMCERELRQESFTRDQEDFLQRTIHAQSFSGWAGARWWNLYDGWYPGLFYRPISKAPPKDTPKEALPQAEGEFQHEHGALRWDALVTDVHTDVPCPNVPSCGSVPDPGSVLHEGIGNAHLLMIAINNGKDRCVYAGPVMSHYEFELIGPPQRMSDPEWKERWEKAGFDKWGPVNNGNGPDWSGIPPHPEWTRGYLVPIKRN